MLKIYVTPLTISIRAPCGRRCARHAAHQFHRYFNPCSHAEDDIRSDFELHSHSTISIHAHCAEIDTTSPQQITRR